MPMLYPVELLLSQTGLEPAAFGLRWTPIRQSSRHRLDRSNNDVACGSPFSTQLIRDPTKFGTEPPYRSVLGNSRSPGRVVEDVLRTGSRIVDWHSTKLWPEDPSVGLSRSGRGGT